MQPPGVPLLLEAHPVLVFNKPPGLLTQAPPGIDSLELRVREWLIDREPRDGKMYLGVPHRLDRPASGAIILARNSRATRRISEQFEGRLVDKTYWACVWGKVLPEAGTWTDYLRKVPGEARAEVASRRDEGAKQAVLHYRTLGYFAWGTWLEIGLETGRTHQIRVQAASRGWPVLGDEQYGCDVPFGPQHEDTRLRAIALHARRVQFEHPKTRERLDVTAPPPEPWRELDLPVD